MRESNVLATIMRECCRGAVRLWRNNVGTGWVGKATRFSSAATVSVRAGDVLVRAARPLHAGLCEGSSDLIGFQTIEVTADMVGRRIAVFVATEVKAEDGAERQAQRDFREFVTARGGIGCVARSPDDLRTALSDFTGID